MATVSVVTRVSELGEETLISRGEEIVAILPEGDPLRFLLQVPVEQLRHMRDNLSTVLARRPTVKRVFEAIIEYRSEGEDS